MEGNACCSSAHTLLLSSHPSPIATPAHRSTRYNEVNPVKLSIRVMAQSNTKSEAPHNSDSTAVTGPNWRGAIG